MSVRIPNSEQLELLEALEFHAGIRMRRPAMFDPHIEPAHAQFRSPGCQRNWASIANAGELARRFAASGGETSEVTVPFVLAVWTLAGVTRTFALDPGTTPQQDRPESSDDDIGRLRDFVAELDRAVTDILSSHAESRRWSSRQEPGDFGRCADFETLLEWWYGGHVTQLGFLAHLSRLLTDHDIDGIMERIPPRLYSVVLAWASEICDALNQGEELWDFISGEPADPARIPVLCRWLARKASVEGH